MELDTAFAHPSWARLSHGHLRVLIALAMARPNRLSNAALFRALQPTKTATDSLMRRVIDDLQPAVATYGMVIVLSRRGYRMAERPRPARRSRVAKTTPLEPVSASVEATAPIVAATPVETVVAVAEVLAPQPLTVEEQVLDLHSRRFSRSAIAAALRVSYATVERALAGGAS